MEGKNRIPTWKLVEACSDSYTGFPGRLETSHLKIHCGRNPNGQWCSSQGRAVGLEFRCCTGLDMELRACSQLSALLSPGKCGQSQALSHWVAVRRTKGKHLLSAAHVAWCGGGGGGGVAKMLIIMMMTMILQRNLDQLPFSQNLLFPQKLYVPALGHSLRSFLKVPPCRWGPSPLAMRGCLRPPGAVSSEQGKRPTTHASECSAASVAN